MARIVTRCHSLFCPSKSSTQLAGLTYFICTYVPKLDFKFLQRPKIIISTQGCRVLHVYSSNNGEKSST